ncbi:hypothetical protein BH09PSE6_BH09PSE6_23350 [soil metagenome]
MSDAYTNRLREYVQSIQRNPSGREARLQRPTGIVRVWMDVTRAGELIEAGIDKPSGSMILDSEAMRTVRQGRYPAFPEEAFAGQPHHRFVISMEYKWN